MGRTRILVVEDDQQTGDSVRELLQAHGYSVQLAADGRQALAHLLDQPQPHLIVLDVCLPVMDGRQLLTVVRAYHRLAAIPVLILSASGLPADSGESAQAVLRKPFTPEDLLASVAALLSQGLPRGAIG